MKFNWLGVDTTDEFVSRLLFWIFGFVHERLSPFELGHFLFTNRKLRFNNPVFTLYPVVVKYSLFSLIKIKEHLGYYWIDS